MNTNRINSLHHKISILINKLKMNYYVWKYHQISKWQIDSSIHK